MVITEDSDLLAFGVDKVLFKMDPQGNGTEIDLADLNNCPEYKIQGRLFTKEMLLQACIMSGCDYHSEGIPGVGYKTALQLVKVHKGDIESICDELYRSGKLNNPREYIDQVYRRAYLTFKHQIVYDHINKRERHLFEPEPS